MTASATTSSAHDLGSTSELDLDLRCRPAEWVDRPESLSDFQTPARAVDATELDAIAEDLLIEAQIRLRFDLGETFEGRRILTTNQPRARIPVGPYEPAPTGDWKLPRTLEAELFDGPRPSLPLWERATPRRLLAAVAALPLLVTPALAKAGGPGSSSGIAALAARSLTAAPPKLPDEPKPKAEPEPETEAGASDQGGGEPPQPGSDGATAAPKLEAPPMAPAPRVDDGLTLTGHTLWEGLMDKRVSLSMQNGQSLTGTVVAQSARDVAVARASDGAVVSVPKADVAGVRVQGVHTGAVGATGGVRTPAPGDPAASKNGSGMTGTGVIFTTFGGIGVVSGIAMLGVCPSCLYIHLPLLVIGGGMLGGGIAMIRKGKKMRKAYNRAWGLPEMAKVKITPTLAAGRSGGNVGLVLRF